MARRSDLRVVITANIPEDSRRLDIRRQLPRIPGIEAILDYVDGAISLYRPEVYEDVPTPAPRRIVVSTFDIQSDKIGTTTLEI